MDPSFESSLTVLLLNALVSCPPLSCSPAWSSNSSPPRSCLMWRCPGHGSRSLFRYPPILGYPFPRTAFVYLPSSRHVPSFGFTHNLSSQEWWFHVFTESYLKTILEFGLEEDVRDGGERVGQGVRSERSRRAACGGLVVSSCFVLSRLERRGPWAAEMSDCGSRWERASGVCCA